MSIDDIKQKVQTIRGHAEDPGKAHSLEDCLHLEVLMAIAAGCDNAAELAAEALKTDDIEFSRWTS
jgi:hypothetical protein